MSVNYREKGFFLIDVLLSVTIWAVIASTFLPMLIHVQKQLVNERQELHGTHLLYETASAYLLYGRQEFGFDERGGFSYEINWYDDGMNKKVCVSYENAFFETVEKCAPIE